eukprot:3247303-Amphidinium_carterae.2
MSLNSLPTVCCRSGSGSTKFCLTSPTCVHVFNTYLVPTCASDSARERSKDYLILSAHRYPHEEAKLCKQQTRCKSQIMSRCVRVFK